MLESFATILLNLYLDIAPLLLFGFLVAGFLHLLVTEENVVRHLGARDGLSVLKSTLFAIPLPLCSCSVVPVVASLRRKGASPGASVSFLVAAPQVGADSYLLTHGLLGLPFALYRLLASLITSLCAGFFENLLPESKRTAAEGDVAAETPGETETAGRATNPPGLWARIRGLPAYLMELLGSLANSLLVGLVLAALIIAIIPDNLLSDLLEGRSWISMLLMLAVGIPMYVCATASTPLAAAFVLKGVSPGAALVFLLTGPATNIVTLSMLSRSLGRRPVLIYLLSISVVAVAAGLVLDLAPSGMFSITSPAEMEHPEGLWYKAVAGVLLAAMLLRYYLERLRGRMRAGREARMPMTGEATTERSRLRVLGMSCAHCAGRVEEAVKALNMVENIRVDHAADLLEYSIIPGSASSRVEEQVRQAVEEAGYDVDDLSRPAE